LGSLIIVDQRKACAPATTKVCAEAEGDDTFLVGFVQGGQSFGEFDFRDVGARWVKDIENKLSSRQKTICEEFACAEGYSRVSLESRT
jgi:hypothetical protein